MLAFDEKWKNRGQALSKNTFQFSIRDDYFIPSKAVFTSAPLKIYSEKLFFAVSLGYILWNFQISFFLKQLREKDFTSVLTQNSILKKSCKSHLKISLTRLFFCELAGCDLTQKGFYRFSWVNFLLNFLDQLFSKTALGGYFCSF